jgi:hypothetical protein
LKFFLRKEIAHKPKQIYKEKKRNVFRNLANDSYFLLLFLQKAPAQIEKDESNLDQDLFKRKTSMFETLPKVTSDPKEFDIISKTQVHKSSYNSMKGKMISYFLCSSSKKAHCTFT